MFQQWPWSSFTEFTCFFSRSITIEETHKKKTATVSYLANGQPFKLLGITYLVGKISRSNFYFRVHWLSEVLFWTSICLSKSSLNCLLPISLGPISTAAKMFGSIVDLKKKSTELWKSSPEAMQIFQVWNLPHFGGGAPLFALKKIIRFWKLPAVILRCYCTPKKKTNMTSWKIHPWEEDIYIYISYWKWLKLLCFSNVMLVFSGSGVWGEWKCLNYATFHTWIWETVSPSKVAGCIHWKPSSRKRRKKSVIISPW